MLSSLQIRNILLIKQLSINFTSGLNVFTGETGAGKSILLDCIGFVLGFRGPSKFVRHGSKQGEVVAIFDLPTHHDAWEILSDAGIESLDNELIIKRINHQDGKKIAFINDQRCSTQILVRLSKKVIEIQGQNQDSELLTDNGPRELIDNFADLRTEVLNIRNVWNTLLDEKINLMKISKEAEEIKKDEDYLTHAINELKEFKPQVGEDIILEKSAALKSIYLQNDKSFGYFHKYSRNSLSSDSNYTSFIFPTGHKFNKLDLEFNLEGERSECNLQSASFLDDNVHQEVKTRVNHLFPNCKSYQKVKNVLNAESKGVYQGKIFVKDVAQKTDAYQLSKALLIKDSSEFNAKPELEIYADDVKCSHGSTSGSVNEDSIYYLMTRGITRKEAVKLLTKAFLYEILDFIADPKIKKLIEKNLDRQIYGH